MISRKLKIGDRVTATRNITTRSGFGVVNPGDTTEVLSVFDCPSGNQIVELSSTCGGYRISDVAVMQNAPCVTLENAK